jgi:hypothetical protein
VEEDQYYSLTSVSVLMLGAMHVSGVSNAVTKKSGSEKLIFGAPTQYTNGDCTNPRLKPHEEPYQRGAMWRTTTTH